MPHDFYLLYAESDILFYLFVFQYNKKISPMNSNVITAAMTELILIMGNCSYFSTYVNKSIWQVHEVRYKQIIIRKPVRSRKSKSYRK